MLSRRQAIVIGPTPPGTGVIAPAIALTEAKSTSPTTRVRPSGSAAALIPTSMTVAPGLTQSPLTFPAARPPRSEYRRDWRSGGHHGFSSGSW